MKNIWQYFYIKAKVCKILKINKNGCCLIYLFVLRDPLQNYSADLNAVVCKIVLIFPIRFVLKFVLNLAMIK